MSYLKQSPQDCVLCHYEALHGNDGEIHNGPDAGGIHEAVAEGAEEEARPRTEAATEELKAEGDSDPETVPGHLQDPDAPIQGFEGPGNWTPPPPQILAYR